MDKKAKKKIEVLRQRITKLRQQLAGAKQQLDDPVPPPVRYPVLLEQFLERRIGVALLAVHARLVGTVAVEVAAHRNIAWLAELKMHISGVVHPVPVDVESPITATE